MPDFYQHDDDGLIHTRFSDLVNCTHKGVLDVARKVAFGKQRNFSSNIIDFGKTRHEMFAEESEKTKETPLIFKEELGFTSPVDMIEQEMVCDIFPGVVLHSTLDAAYTPSGLIVDYKTATIKDDGEKSRNDFKLHYKRSKQHLTYALQLLNKGIIPSRAVYLGEFWNSERTELLGYDMVDIPITLEEVVEFKNTWLRDRAERLVVAVDYFRKTEGKTLQSM